MRKNLLLITADQWRGDATSLAGHPVVRTPHLDRLAQDGVAFLCHYGQATPCAPARASLYTGLYLFNHRVVGNGSPLDSRHHTLASWLRRFGYDAVLFGFTDVAADPRELPENDPRLFTYEGVAPGFRAECLLLSDLGPWRAHLEAKGMGAELEELWARPLGAPAPYPAAASETAFLTDRFLAWLARRPAEPWFAHLSYIKPHPPWVLPDPWHRAVDPRRLKPPARRPSPSTRAHPWLRASLRRPPSSWTERVVAARPLSEPELTLTLRALYFASVMEVDHHLGRVFRELERRGLLDRTLVVVTADHGEMLGELGMWDKDSFHPAWFHVPLVIRDPEARVRGLRVRRFTAHVDLFPTITERLGLPTPLQCDGEALTPFLAGQSPRRWREGVVYEFDFRDPVEPWFETRLGLDPDSCCLITYLERRWLYVQFAALPPLLFDRLQDPLAAIDRGRDPRLKEVRLALAERLLAFRLHRAERRLSGVRLTAKGPVGRFDPP